jgi:hypothetical protein
MKFDPSCSPPYQTSFTPCWLRRLRRGERRALPLQAARPSSPCPRAQPHCSSAFAPPPAWPCQYLPALYKPAPAGGARARCGGAAGRRGSEPPQPALGMCPWQRRRRGAPSLFRAHAIGESDRSVTREYWGKDSGIGFHGFGEQRK